MFKNLKKGLLISEFENLLEIWRNHLRDLLNGQSGNRNEDDVKTEIPTEKMM